MSREDLIARMQSAASKKTEEVKAAKKAAQKGATPTVISEPAPVPKVEQKATVQGEISPRELTPAGKQILASVVAGGIPLSINRRFQATLAENGIQYRTDMVPNEAVEALQIIERDWDKKQASGVTDNASSAGPKPRRADVAVTRIRKTRRRGSGGKPKRQEPIVVDTSVPVIVAVPPISVSEPAIEPAPTSKAATVAPFEEPSWVDLVKDDKPTITVAKSEPAQGTAVPEAVIEPMPTPQAAPEAVAKETTPGNFEIKEGRYRAASNGVVRTISKETKKNGKEIYYETFGTGEVTEYRSLKALNKVAEKEGWKLEDAATQTSAQVEQIVPDPGAPRGPEVPLTAPAPEVSENKFSELEKNLEDARQRYAKDDFEKTSILRKISAVLRFDTTKLKDVDGAKEEYDKAFQNLLNTRLEDIQKRRKELGEENYRREMGQALMSFECEGRIKIFQARQQVRMESLAQSKIGWLVESVPRLAHAYNKLPKKYRYGIGIALGLGTMATFGTGAAALAPAMVALRRVLTGASTFATLDTLMESLSDRYNEGKAQKSGSETYTEFALLEKEERTPEEIAQAKSEFLEARMKGIHEQYKRRKVGMVARKTTAMAAGLFMGSGYMQEKIGGWIKGGFDWSKGVPPIEAESGDSTWKLLGQYLSAKDPHFPGMNEAERTYAIDALKDKLQAMSSEQLKSAGFGSGDIGKLGIGEHIDFDKLVGSDVARAMASASGLSPEAVESITQNNADILKWARMHPDVKLTDAVVDSVLHENAAETVSGSPTAIDVQNQGDFLGQGLKIPAADIPKTADTLSVHDEVIVNAQEAAPAFAAELQPRVDDWYMQIFRVENARSGQDWVFDKAAIAKVRVLDIVKDARLLQQGSFSGYVTGLNSEQVRNFAEFSQNVAKSNIGFDGAAFFRENPGATVMDYLKKVAPLVQQGQRLGLYTATR